MTTLDSFRSLVQSLLRRRGLVLTTLALMVPVSIAFALIVPPRYQARSLAQFQEIEVENPLARATTSAVERVQERITGLRALLKSDAVLGPIADSEAAAGVDPALPRSERISRLRDALGVEAVGANLIEFKLTGSPGAGLGTRLDRIMNNFLETYRQVAPQRAGARLVLIDPPKDPERPVAGRSLTALIGMAAGLVLGLTLALAAEALDRRVRTEADLRRIPDLPPVLRLPRLTPPKERRVPAPPARRRFAKAAAPVLLALLAVIGLNHYNMPTGASSVIDWLRKAAGPEAAQPVALARGKAPPPWWNNGERHGRTGSLGTHLRPDWRPVRAERRQGSARFHAACTIAGVAPHRSSLPPRRADVSLALSRLHLRALVQGLLREPRTRRPNR